VIPEESEVPSLAKGVMQKPPLAGQGGVVLPKNVDLPAPKTEQPTRPMKSSLDDKWVIALGVDGNPLIIELPIESIMAMPDQPRKEFDEAAIQELGASLAQESQQELITVRLLDAREMAANPGKVAELVNGERRLRGAQMAGVQTLRAYVREFKTRADQFWASFVMNWNHQGHTPLESAEAIARAMANGKTAREISRAIHRSVNWVHRHARLNDLGPEIKELMRMNVKGKNRIRLSCAETLAKVKDKEQQWMIWQEASKQPYQKLIQKKVEELAGPHWIEAKTNCRKLKPGDRVVPFLRVLKRYLSDVTVSDSLKPAEFGAIMATESVAKEGVDDPVRYTNEIIRMWESIKSKLIKARTEMRKKKD
jgi:ParB/RepB/Spo0J family partition protein